MVGDAHLVGDGDDAALAVVGEGKAATLWVLDRLEHVEGAVGVAPGSPLAVDDRGQHAIFGVGALTSLLLYRFVSR